MSDRPAHDAGAERRREILIAAEEVFARKGYRGTTMGDVAHAVGVTQPALYRYFASKQELFMGALALRQREIAERYGEVLRGAGPAVDKIRALVDATVLLALERPAMARLRLQAIATADEPAVGEAVTRTLNDLVRAHTALFERAREEGGLRTEMQPQTAAASLAGLALFLYASLALDLPYAEQARSGVVDFLDAILEPTR